MKSNIPYSQPNKLYWIYFLGFCLILALPLLNLPPWFSPPDWGKTIVLRVVLSVLIFLFIYQLLFKKESFSVVQRIVQRISAAKTSFYLLIALLCIYLLATIFSQDIYFSLWGNPYRSGGFVNFTFYVVFAILTFLILRQKDWQKIWDFSILIGILVSIIAIFQQFGLISKVLIYFLTRPPSTIGGPTFLAIYLLLLSFFGLSFGLKERKWLKKIFYFVSFLLFVFIATIITQARAVTIGFAVSLLYFIFFYPAIKRSASLVLKFTILILLVLGIYGFYYFNTHPLPKFIQESEILSTMVQRSSIKAILQDPRVSGWKVSFESMKAKPILGYGPENFNIAFDKYYNPSLPEIERPPGGGVDSWWDRAHNFIFDIALTAGVPALLIYLALFGVLFFQLQKLKNADKYADSYAEKTPKVIYHGIQATFIGYLVANFFSFDTFSSYLISFLLIGYSLHLISLNTAEETLNNTLNRAESSALNQRKYQRWFRDNIIKRKKTTITILTILLLWFNWMYNIKPFKINTQINVAKYLIGDKKCEQTFVRMDEVLQKKSFLDSYLRLKYADFLMQCEPQHPEKTLEYAQKGTELLKENIKIQPNYVRNWLLLAGFMDVLIDREQSPENWEKMVQETEGYLEKAEELSPKRQEVFLEWAKFTLVANNFQLMKEKSQKCIDVNPNLSDCYWFNGLAEIFLGNLDEGKINIKIAEEKGFGVNSLISLTQLVKAHSIAKNYEELVIIYQKLIFLKPEEPQYHATLAFVYKELKDYKKAREEAMKVLELQPEAREMVDEFLRTLR